MLVVGKQKVICYSCSQFEAHLTGISRSAAELDRLRPALLTISSGS